MWSIPETILCDFKRTCLLLFWVRMSREYLVSSTALMYYLKPPFLYWLCICPLDSPGKNPGADFHLLLQGTFLTQGSILCFLHRQVVLYHCTTWEAPRSPCLSLYMAFFVIAIYSVLKSSLCEYCYPHFTVVSICIKCIFPYSYSLSMYVFRSELNVL